MKAYHPRHGFRRMGHIAFMAVGLVLPQVSAQAESVRDRLQRAIDVSRELEALGVAPATGMMESMISGWNYPAPPVLRVTAERLLELLDRGNLWEDVNWDHEYSSLAARLGMWAGGLFRPEHVPRLRAALLREHDGLSKLAQAALTIGISRLLPAATPENPDAAETRDGVLRHTVLHDPDPTVRTDCVMELVRVGLPVNAPLLKQLAFEIHTDDRTRSAVLSGILHALGQTPFSKAKRELLIDLVLDERFRAMWTQSIRTIDDETCRGRAIKAINAHAGREWISRDLGAALADPSRSAKALVQIRDRVDRLRRDVGWEDRK